MSGEFGRPRDGTLQLAQYLTRRFGEFAYQSLRSAKNVSSHSLGRAHLPALDGLRGARVARRAVLSRARRAPGRLPRRRSLLRALGVTSSRRSCSPSTRDAERIDLGAFWIRRARRLFPALLSLMPAIAIYGWCHREARRAREPARRRARDARLRRELARRSSRTRATGSSSRARRRSSTRGASRSRSSSTSCGRSSSRFLLSKRRPTCDPVTSRSGSAIASMIEMCDPRTPRARRARTWAPTRARRRSSRARRSPRSCLQRRRSTRAQCASSTCSASFALVGPRVRVVEARRHVAVSLPRRLLADRGVRASCSSCARSRDRASLVARALVARAAHATSARSATASISGTGRSTASSCPRERFTFTAARSSRSSSRSRSRSRSSRSTSSSARSASAASPSARPRSSSPRRSRSRVAPRRARDARAQDRFRANPLPPPEIAVADAGADAVPFRVMVLGDSTANSLGWALRGVREPGVAIELRGKDGCTMLWDTCGGETWQRRSTKEVHPDVTLVYVGGAFLHGITADGRWRQACYPKWDEQFERDAREAPHRLRPDTRATSSPSPIPSAHTTARRGARRSTASTHRCAQAPRRSPRPPRPRARRPLLPEGRVRVRARRPDDPPRRRALRHRGNARDLAVDHAADPTADRRPVISRRGPSASP